MLVLSLTCIFFYVLNGKLLNFLFSSFRIVSKDQALLVHFIDVGQADAIAINLPNGEIMLIDAGIQENNVKYTKYIKENVLNNKFNNQIDYLIISHAHDDHYGGVIKLINDFDVEKVYLPIDEATSNSYQNVLSVVKNKCNYETISLQTKFNVENCIIEIFGLYDGYADENYSCAVVKVTYLNKSFLFTADIPEEIENKLILDYGNKLDCDVLKVAHHGSEGSSSVNFLNVATPDYSVISVGVNNMYGHPNDEVISNLKLSNSKILRTDVQGNILFVVSKDYGLSFITSNYFITNSKLDYRIFVLIIDLVLIADILVIFLRKNKKNKHKTQNFTL